MSNDSKEPTIIKKDFATKKGEIALRDHVYDGIEEYDQKLPNWWLTVLWIFIAFFFIYYAVYYSFGIFQSEENRIDDQIAKVEEARSAAMNKALAELNDDVLVNTWSTDTSKVKAGKAIYMKNCAACHSQDLGAYGGAAALPLNDGKWKYGDKPMDVFKIISEGTPANSAGLNGARMEVWKKKISPQQIAEVVAYLIHKNPKDFSSYKK